MRRFGAAGGIVVAMMAVTAGHRADAGAAAADSFWHSGDVIFEIVGQARVPSPTSAIQYGYLSSIAGIDGIYASDFPGGQNETTAFFTFFNTATTLQVTARGGLVIVRREGAMTVYLDPAPNGDFAVPESFADGTPVQTSAWEHQVILDSATARFSVVFMNTITSARPFDWGGRRGRLGAAGSRFRIAGSGLLQAPGVFDLAGHAVLGGNRPLQILKGLAAN